MDLNYIKEKFVKYVQQWGPVYIPCNVIRGLNEVNRKRFIHKDRLAQIFKEASEILKNKTFNL